MLSIRLRRVGKKKQPLYRLIVLDKTKDPWGDYLENLGTYNPRVKPKQIAFKADRIKHWLLKGAQCTDTVWNLFLEQKIVEGEKRKTARISKKRKAKIAAKAKAA
jgi:small subunit ribosomal protein S16